MHGAVLDVGGESFTIYGGQGTRRGTTVDDRRPQGGLESAVAMIEYATVAIGVTIVL